MKAASLKVDEEDTNKPCTGTEKGFEDSKLKSSSTLKPEPTSENVEDDEEEVPSEDSPEQQKGSERKIPEAPGSSSISKMSLEAAPATIKKASTTPQRKFAKKGLEEDSEETHSSMGMVNPFLQNEDKRSLFLEGSDTPPNTMIGNIKKPPILMASVKGENGAVLSPSQQKTDVARKLLQKLE